MSASRNTRDLLFLVTIAWLLIVCEGYFFIAVIRPLGPPIHGVFLPSTVLKVMLTLGLGAVWVAVMFTMDSLYSRRRMTPT
jgi:hypothetical protein